MTEPGAEDHVISDPAVPAPRLRLIDCVLTRVPGGYSRVTVRFETPDRSNTLTHTEQATASPAGDLRLAALATVGVLGTATNSAFHADVLGVKPMRAFDSTIMVVALSTRVDGVSKHLVGAAIADQDQLVAVVTATLQAVNRVVSPLLR